MVDWGRFGNRGQHRPPGSWRGGTSRRPVGAGAPKPLKRAGRLGLHRLERDEFEIAHPRCVLEREPDYADAMEMWKAGDPEGARDALRYALSGCGDNLWIHVALGRIALEEDKDPKLARGHFGYAFELVERTLPRGFTGRLPKELDANRPLYDAADGLAACYEALGRLGDARDVRAQAARWAGTQGPAAPP